MSLSEDFTLRNAAKFVALATVDLNVTRIVKDFVVDNTNLDKDSIAVKISSRVVGAYVAHKSRPYTDRMVDNAADRIVVFRAKRQNDKNIKKNAPK